jgi:hypothetical protein
MHETFGESAFSHFAQSGPHCLENLGFLCCFQLALFLANAMRRSAVYWKCQVVDANANPDFYRICLFEARGF